jgi:Fic family protein
VLYITEATTEQVKYTCAILEKISRAITSVKTLLNDKLKYLYTSELVDFLFSNAYFTQKNFETDLGISPMTARKYLKDLEKEKIITKHRQMGKNRYIYITPRYITILKQV